MKYEEEVFEEDPKLSTREPAVLPVTIELTMLPN